MCALSSTLVVLIQALFYFRGSHHSVLVMPGVFVHLEVVDGNFSG